MKARLSARVALSAGFLPLVKARLSARLAASEGPLDRAFWMESARVALSAGFLPLVKARLSARVAASEGPLAMAFCMESARVAVSVGAEVNCCAAPAGATLATKASLPPPRVPWKTPPVARPEEEEV